MGQTKEKTRYEKLKKQTALEMAGTLSYYFGCDRCPAKREDCCENDAMCIDAIKEWLNSEGQF